MLFLAIGSALRAERLGQGEVGTLSETQIGVHIASYFACIWLKKCFGWHLVQIRVVSASRPTHSQDLSKGGYICLGVKHV